MSKAINMGCYLMDWKMLTLQANNAPAIFKSNDKSDGFIFITIATAGSQTYRIVKEETIQGKVKLSQYDFKLTPSEYSQGEVVLLNIPHVSSDYKTTPTTPQEIPRSRQATSEVFRGVTFKLLNISAYENLGDAFEQRLINAEIPSLIDFRQTYMIGTPTKKVRFIYFRFIEGIPKFTGYLGNSIIDGQYVEDIDIGDTPGSLFLLESQDILYYVIQVDAIPNVIVVSGQGQSQSPLNQVVEEYVDDKDRRFKLVCASGSVRAGKTFRVDIYVTEADGSKPAKSPLKLILLNPDGNLRFIEQGRVSNDTAYQAYLILQTSKEAENVSFKVFFAWDVSEL